MLLVALFVLAFVPDGTAVSVPPGVPRQLEVSPARTSRVLVSAACTRLELQIRPK